MIARLIARLDIKGPNLVKGIHLEGLRVLGRPEDFARHYYDAGADELMYVDVVASLYGRNSLRDIITRTAREIAIPLTVGGGIRTVDDIRGALRAGADKVSINTAAVGDPDLVRRAAREFGSSTVVVTLEVIEQLDGSYECFTDNGREQTGLDALEWASRLEDMGAGELVLTSVDREGTGSGLDTSITSSIVEALSIPVVAHGGVGSAGHVAEGFRAGVSAVALASMLHYASFREIQGGAEYAEGNLEFLRRGALSSRVTPTTLPELRTQLLERGIECRQTAPVLEEGR